MEGGENPYRFAENTIEWVDPLGLTGAPSAKTHAKKYAQTLRTQKRKGNHSGPLPTTVAAVVNRKTGEVFYGKSGTKPKVTHPELIKAMPRESSEKWSVNNCAEVDGLNQALSRKGTRMEDLEVHAVDTETGKTKKPCKNCQTTTSGTYRRK